MVSVPTRAKIPDTFVLVGMVAGYLSIGLTGMFAQGIVKVEAMLNFIIRVRILVTGLRLMQVVTSLCHNHEVTVRGIVP